MENEEARQKIIDAIESGRVVFPEGVEKILSTVGAVSREDPDYRKITKVSLMGFGNPKNPSDDNIGGFTVSWQAHGIGFGTLDIFNKDGKIYCDNEGMSLQFIKDILCALVDQSIMKN